MGGVSWAKWLCKLERQGLGQRFARENGVGAIGISYRYRRYQISVSSISVIGVGIVDIAHSLNPIKVRNNHSSPKPWDGGVSWAKWLCKLERQGLGQRLGRESVSSIPKIGIVDIGYRHRRISDSGI